MNRQPQHKRFPSDINDEQWQVIEPLIPAPRRGGRRRSVNLRQVVNAIRYLQTTGCSWRELPESFPNRSTVWYYYSAWRKLGLWQKLDSTMRLCQAVQSGLEAAGSGGAAPHQGELPEGELPK